MPTGEITWREKVRAHMRRVHIRAPELAERMGRSERTVRAWLKGTNRPLEETRVIRQIAAALNLDPASITDGSESPATSRPAALQIPAELIDRVPAKARRLIFAVADEETLDLLLAQLDLIEGVRRRARGQA